MLLPFCINSRVKIIRNGGMQLSNGLRRFNSSLCGGKHPAAPGRKHMTGFAYKRVVGVLVAGSMVFSSTAAVAATQPAPSQVDPWAVLSVMSGGASAAAVCGAAAAAAAAQAPGPGCVLPAVDQAPVAATPPPAPIPVPPVEPAGTGLGISPLLIGLLALAGGLALYFVLRHHHNHGNSPA
jgi:hypothetical protein